MSLRELLLRRRYGGPGADAVLRATGLVAAIGIPLALWVPDAGAMVGFVLVTIWLNGPLAPVMPAAYEAVIMLFGRIFPPFWVAVLAIVGSLYVEFLNYHLHRRVLKFPSIARIGRRAWVRRIVDLYRRSPFLAVWVCSWSPLPYWPVRFFSPLADYPVGKHLLATFLGRFPRVWFFAALGRWWGIPSSWLLAFAVAGVGLGLAVWLFKRFGGRARRRPADDPQGTSAASSSPPVS